MVADLLWAVLLAALKLFRLSNNSPLYHYDPSSGTDVFAASRILQLQALAQRGSFASDQLGKFILFTTASKRGSPRIGSSMGSILMLTIPLSRMANACSSASKARFRSPSCA